MSWIAQLTGHFDHPDAADSAAAETKLAEGLREQAQALTDAGAVGVAATFTGEHIGAVNLLAEPAPDVADNADALGGNTPDAPAEGETQAAGTAVADGTPGPAPDAVVGDQTAAEGPAPGTPGYVAPLPGTAP
jgi:hypothetical protein